MELYEQQQQNFFLQNKNIHPVVYINSSSFYSKNKNKILFVIYILYIIKVIFRFWKLILYTTNFLTKRMKDWK